MYDAINSKYTYPNSCVIKNKLNIKDEKKLEDYERQMVSFKLATIRKHDMPEKFDANKLKYIHNYLFCDIYDFAGEYREENITKDNFMFAQYEYLDENVNLILDKIQINELIKMSFEEKIKNISYYMTELNVLHPFREGNGRTIREFIRQLLQAIGLEIDFSKIEYEEIIRVSKLAVIDDTEQIDLLRNSVCTIKEIKKYE